MADKIKINLADLLDADPRKIAVDKCIISGAQAAQSGREVTEDDPLVISIRDMGGLMHPIIVQKLNDGNFDVITGQRRWKSHVLLGMTEIKSFVIDRELSEAEKKVISFAENVGQKEMARKDYVDVIGYFYDRYGGGKAGIADAAETLGIKIPKAKEYLKEARFPEEIKAEIAAGTFTQDLALKSLLALGDDEENIDVPTWIEVTKDMKLVEPGMRGEVARVMKKHPGWTRTQAEDYVKEQKKKKENIVKIEATESQLERLEAIQAEQKIDDRDEAAAAVFDKGLDSFT